MLLLNSLPKLFRLWFCQLSRVGRRYCNPSFRQWRHRLNTGVTRWVSPALTLFDTDPEKPRLSFRIKKQVLCVANLFLNDIADASFGLVWFGRFRTTSSFPQSVLYFFLALFNFFFYLFGPFVNRIIYCFFIARLRINKVIVTASWMTSLGHAFRLLNIALLGKICLSLLRSWLLCIQIALFLVVLLILRRIRGLAAATAARTRRRVFHRILHDLIIRSRIVIITTRTWTSAPWAARPALLLLLPPRFSRVF